MYIEDLSQEQNENEPITKESPKPDKPSKSSLEDKVLQEYIELGEHKDKWDQELDDYEKELDALEKELLEEEKEDAIFDAERSKKQQLGGWQLFWIMIGVFVFVIGPGRRRRYTSSVPRSCGR